MVLAAAFAHRIDLNLGYQVWSCSGPACLTWTPNFFKCFMSSCASRCFVIRSAGFSLPKTFSTLTLLVRKASCIHNACVSRCLNLPNPFLWAIPMAAEAST